MRTVNMEELKKEYKGKHFGELILYQLKKHKNPAFYHVAVRGTISMLPQEAQNMAEDFIDRWLSKAYESEFWEEDASDILSKITGDACELLRKKGLPIDDEIVFNMFNLVVLSYSYNAAGKKEMRDFIKKSIKKKTVSGIRSLMNNWDKKTAEDEKHLQKICRDKKVIKVLEQNNCKCERLKDILDILLVTGIKEMKVWELIEKPKLLSKYLQLESESYSSIEIANKMHLF